MGSLRKIWDGLSVPYEENCPLSRHSSFRIGGPAALGIFPQSREQLTEVLERVCREQIPYLVIGKGSNVVFSDDGFDGAVIFTEGCRTLVCKENELRADAGVPLVRLAQVAWENALTGAEFAHGIPGSLGGAVFMNAGAYGGCMADICASSAYFDTASGSIKTLTGAEQAFAIRESIYTHHPEWVILGATLCLRQGEPAQIHAAMEDFSVRRKATQPLEFPSAGSVFKRPAGHYAGRLIEDCGLKGTAVGGAQVSLKHAGFIVNRGGATAEDVKHLVAQIQETVLARTGVSLECEIRFL